jgi:hypothetical protein
MISLNEIMDDISRARRSDTVDLIRGIRNKN